MSLIEHRNRRNNKHLVSISYKGGSDVFWFKEDYTPNQFPEPIKAGEFLINKLEAKLNLVYDKDFYADVPHAEIDKLKCAVIIFRGTLSDECARMWASPTDKLLSFPKDWVRGRLS